MTFDDYQSLALRTVNPSLTPNQRLGMAALGLCGESGEAGEVVKKHLYHHAALDRSALIKETGDALWYIALMCDCLGISLSELAQLNIDKLQARYPEGFK